MKYKPLNKTRKMFHCSDCKELVTQNRKIEDAINGLKEDIFDPKYTYQQRMTKFVTHKRIIKLIDKWLGVERE